jgi:hypothetical protein
MPSILLSETAFDELKSLAEPFVDTPESLTARLIHEEVVRRGIQPQRAGTNTDVTPRDASMRLNPISHENLAHTRVISATVDGQEIYRPKWNGLMEHVHILARKRLGSFDAVSSASGARLREGRYEDEGFKYLPEADLSIQGVDANLSWDHSLKLARAVGVSVQVIFEWRDKEGAVFPGKRGVLEWTPTRLAHIRTPRLANPEQARNFRKQIVEIPADVKI